MSMDGAVQILEMINVNSYLSYNETYLYWCQHRICQKAKAKFNECCLCCFFTFYPLWHQCRSTVEVGRAKVGR